MFILNSQNIDLISNGIIELKDREKRALICFNKILSFIILTLIIFDE